MAEILMKPIEMVPTTAAVAGRPAKQMPQPVQRTIVAPLDPWPTTRTPIARPILPEKPNVESELTEIRRAWRLYRGRNSRDAVYIYLSKVFQVVSRWQRVGCALKNARAALRRRPNPSQMKPEPFGIMIFCTADPKIVDAKTRSKWSRVLRYAGRASLRVSGWSIL